MIVRSQMLYEPSENILMQKTQRLPLNLPHFPLVKNWFMV